MRRFSKFFPRIFKVFPQRIQSFQAYVGEGEQSSVHTAWTGAQQRMLEYASCAARGVCKGATTCTSNRACTRVSLPHAHTPRRVWVSPHEHACRRVYTERPPHLIHLFACKGLHTFMQRVYTQPSPPHLPLTPRQPPPAAMPGA